MDKPVEIDPLTRLAIKHGTDKWGLHFYTPVYHGLFAHLRERPVRLLEIGIGGSYYRSVGGASLAMWAEYFPNGRIVGIDIEEKRLASVPRVTLLKGSQADTEFLVRTSAQYGPFDIVIDDGSHVPSDVVTSFLALFTRMAGGGWYVIEDVQTCFWPRFGGSLIDGGATMALVRSLLEDLNHAEIKTQDPARKFSDTAPCIRAIHAFHNIFAFEKGDNGEPSNADYRLDNPHAAHALKTIEQELEREPTPEGIANLAGVFAGGGDLAKAQSLLERGLEKWPDHVTLLATACEVANFRGDRGQSADFLARLVDIEPDNGTLARMLARARSDAQMP